MNCPDYTEFDQALLQMISEGWSTMAQLETNSKLRALAEPHRVKQGLWGVPTPTFRVIDRRLQALRKRGQIRYDGKAWARVDKMGAV
jgi:hypothetical protein